MKDMYPSLVLFALALTSSVCKGQHGAPCSVIPKDQYIEAGSDTVVMCQTLCFPGKVYWTLNNRPIDDSLSKAINSSHTVLTLRNFTHHNATLQCHNADTQQILGGVFITTYTKPTKLSCFLYNENPDQGGVPQLVTCNWEHQRTSPLRVTYTLLYAKSNWPETETEICTSHVPTCTNKSEIRTYVNGVLTVRAQTDEWVVNSDPYEFDPHDILKMSRPKVEVTPVLDRLLVKLKWEELQKMLHCQVKYGKAVANETLEVINTPLGPQPIEVVTIENLDSCTYYKISGRCAIHTAPWSEWTQERTVLSKLNRKHVKLWRKVAKPDENGIRRVRAMWTEIPSTCQGTFTCAIKVSNNGASTDDNYTDILCGNSTYDVDVNRDAHTINLRVLEKETLLAEASVYVPATGESLPQVTDMWNTTLERVILVGWKAPLEPVSSYMIDWTHDGNRYYWNETEYTNTTLLGLLDKKLYNITVTPLFDNKTGHGAQVLKICSRVGDPGNVTMIQVTPKDKSVFVSWNTTLQEECAGAVLHYTVFYGGQTEPMLNVTVDGRTHGVNLKDLNPDTHYRVCVTATALTGSTKSTWRLFKTERFDPRLPLALGVCGSIIIVLVLSLGLFCAFQWKKFSKTPVPNPGLSSVALWSSPTQQKRGSFQPFSNPSESHFDQIFTAGNQKTLTSPPAASCNPISLQTEEHTEPAPVLAPEVQNDKSAEQHLCSPGESTALLTSGSGPISPYRSQSSGESPASLTGKQCKRISAKQLEKTAPLTVYITMDMYEQGQSR